MIKKIIAQLLLCSVLLACSSTQQSHHGQEDQSNNSPLPALALKLEQSRLSGVIVVLDSNLAEVHRSNLTINDSTVATESFDLDIGKTYNFYLIFSYQLDSGDTITIATISFTKDVTSESNSFGFTESDVSYDATTITANISAIDLNMDSDGDSVSNIREIAGGTDPLDANSSPAAITVNLTELQVVKDSITIIAEYNLTSDIETLTLEQPVLQDENSQARVLKATYDTTNLTDDNQIELIFRATTFDGRHFRLVRKLVIDNIPNITSFNGTELIQQGDEVGLNWEADNLTNVEIENIASDLGGKGEHRFKPTQTQTYRLRATRTNNNGQTFTSTKEFTVTVNNPPTFDNHLTNAKGHDPHHADGTLVQWQHSDDAADTTHDSTISLFRGTTCTGQAIATASTTSKSHGFQNLDPREDYSYHVTIADNRGGQSQSPCQAFTTSDKDLMGWWRFKDVTPSETPDTSAHTSDSSGNDLTATLKYDLKDAPENAGLPTIDQDVINLDGFDDYVELPDLKPSDNENGGFSLSARIHIDSAGRYRDLVSKFSSEERAARAWDLALESDNTLSFYIYEDPTKDSPFYKMTSSTTLSQDQWYQLDVVVDTTNKTVLFYIDGQRFDSVDTVKLAEFGTINLVDEGIRLSGYGTDAAIENNFQIEGEFGGQFDDFALFSRPLTAKEIRSYCAREYPDVCNSLSPAAIQPAPGGTFDPDSNGQFEFIKWVTADDATYSYSLWQLPTAASDKADGTLVQDNINTATVSQFDPNGILKYRTSYLIEVTACAADDVDNCQTNSWRFTTSHHGLVGWWRFDEGENSTANDSSNYQNHGSLETTGNDSATWTQTAIQGQALDFDGSDDYIKVLDNDALESPTTIELWFQPNGGTGRVSLVDKVDGSTNPQEGYFLFLDHFTGGDAKDDPVIWTSNKNNSRFEASISLNQWHHLVLIDDNGIRRLYINGTLLDQDLADETIKNNNLNFIIGANVNTGTLNEFFDGVMDEVALYNRALTPAEIRAHCQDNHPDPNACEDSCVPVQLLPSDDQVLETGRAFLGWRDTCSNTDIVDHFDLCYARHDNGEAEPQEFQDIGNDANCGTLAEPTEANFIITGLDDGDKVKWKVRTCYTDNTCTGYSPVWEFSGEADLLPFVEWNFNDNLEDSSDSEIDLSAPNQNITNNAGDTIALTGPSFVANGDSCNGEEIQGLKDNEKAACFEYTADTYKMLNLDSLVNSIAFASTEKYTAMARFQAFGTQVAASIISTSHATGATPGYSLSIQKTESGQAYINSEIYDNHIQDNPRGELDNLTLSSPTYDAAINDYFHGAFRYDGDADGGTLSLSVNGNIVNSGYDEFDFLNNGSHFTRSSIGNPSRCPASENLCFTQAPMVLDYLYLYDHELSVGELRNNYCLAEVDGETDPLPEVCR